MKKSLAYNETDYYDDFRQFLHGIARKYGDRPAVTLYTRKGVRVDHSYTDLERDALSFGTALLKNGFGGQHIAIVSENCYEWMVCYFGASSAGCVAVCVDIEQPEDKIVEMLEASDAVAAVTSRSLLPICLKAQSALPRLRTVLSMYPDTEKCPTLADFCAEGRAALEGGDTTLESTPLSPQQTASLVYTSGTAGRSKAVMLSHRGILHNSSDSLALITVSPHRSFAVLPLYHAYGVTGSVLSSLIAGINVCLNGDLKTMIRDMELFKPETLIAVPLIAESIHKFVWASIEKSGKRQQVCALMKLGRLLGDPGLFVRPIMAKKFQGTCLESLNLIMCGGAYLAEKVAEELQAFGILVLLGYGITECSPLVSVNRTCSYDFKSVGWVLPSCKVKIQDDEILVSGSTLMNGYYNRPELTAQSMQGDWFKTGDLGYLDCSGRLYITGRIKNLIVMKNGKKVSPEEIENKLAALPLVKEVVAYGATSGSSTDDVKIAVMVYPDPDQTQNLSSYEILEQLQAQVDAINRDLPIYKQIQNINLRATEFEKTAARKVKRTAI